MQTDEGDALPEPCEPPPGFAFAALPPTEAALCFTKQSVLSPEADELVGEVGGPLQLECHRLAEGHHPAVCLRWSHQAHQHAVQLLPLVRGR